MAVQQRSLNEKLKKKKKEMPIPYYLLLLRCDRPTRRIVIDFTETTFLRFTGARKSTGHTDADDDDGDEGNKGL